MDTERLKSLELKYHDLPIAWAIVEIIEGFLKQKAAQSEPVTLDEIQHKIVHTSFDMLPRNFPEMHQILASRDMEFVEYIFYLAS